MLSERIFNSYLYAAKELNTIEERYKKERAEAYSDVSPTMTIPDYSLGKIVSGSVSVEDHAVHLFEIYHQYEKDKENCLVRLSLMNEAISLLYEDERVEFEAWKDNYNLEFPQVLETLRTFVEHLLNDDNDELSVEEWDEQVESMSDEELFTDYYDSNGDFDKEIIRHRMYSRIFNRPVGRRSDAEMNERVS